AQPNRWDARALHCKDDMLRSLAMARTALLERASALKSMLAAQEALGCPLFLVPWMKRDCWLFGPAWRITTRWRARGPTRHLTPLLIQTAFRSAASRNRRCSIAAG